VNRPGMTLLELLCASMLATLLMVAVLGVISGLAKAEKTLDRHQPPAEWRRRLVSRISNDLRAASSAEPLPTGVRLTGPLGRDARTGAADWTDAAVEYRVEATPLGPALMRVVLLNGGGRHIETLTHSIRSLVITGAGGAPLAPDTTKAFVNEAIDGGALPARLRMVMFDQADQVVFDEEIVAR
jgi:hypothetical protein